MSNQTQNNTQSVHYNISERTYLAQFNDNPKCVRAYQLAIQHLNRDTDIGRLIKQCTYVAAVAAQSIDDDVYIAAMLHPLAEVLTDELATQMTGLGFEALKVVQVLPETKTYTDMYEKTSALEHKYKGIIVARVMYKLLHIDLLTFTNATLLIDEAITKTAKLEAPHDIMVQFNIILDNAIRYYEESYSAEVPKDGFFTEKSITTLDAVLGGDTEDDVLTTGEGKDEVTEQGLDKIYLSSAEEDAQYRDHVKLASELGLKHRDTVDIPGIGEVTYHAAIGFCDANGEFVDITVNSKYEEPPKASIDDKPSVNDVSNTPSVPSSTPNSTPNGTPNGNNSTLEATKSYVEMVDTHHRLARLLKLQHNAKVVVSGIGEVTYDEHIGFLSDTGILVDLNLIAK